LTRTRTQFIIETGFLKNMTLVTTTATRFIVLPTLKVTGLIPWSNTMYDACKLGLGQKDVGKAACFSKMNKRTVQIKIQNTAS
jgi:hypothetical protein